VAAAVAVITAIVLQAAVLARLPLPGGQPSLTLVLVVAIGLAAGPNAGLASGFGAGLLTDLLSDHPVGVLALCFALAGFLAGLLEADVERTVLLPVVVVAVATAAVYLTYLGVLGLLGSSTADGAASILGTVAYDVVLTPFVVPPVVAVARRFAPSRRLP
jgi:rod shape-determining protein MreD